MGIRKNVIGIGIIVATVFILIALPLPQDKIVFLDVGQGDSVLLQDGTEQILVDGGPGQTVLQRLGEELPWFDKTIEVVIATHPDQDHLEGLLHVIERYNVKFVILPFMPHTTELQSEWLNKLRTAVEAKKIAYRFGWRGEKIESDDMRLEVLSPDQATLEKARQEEKTNNGGIVLRADFHNRAVLLTADVDMSVEQEMISTVPAEKLNVDILKVGHHGSKYSTSDQLVMAASSSVAVISVGSNNRYGHPTAEALQRLKSVSLIVRTDEAGSIRFIYDGQAWLLNCSKRCNK